MNDSDTKTDSMTDAAMGAMGILGAIASGGVPPVFELCGPERANDHGVYNLGTPEGRAAWKANAPEGAERIVVEDGEAWTDAVVDEFRNMVQAYAERFAV